MDFQTVSQQTRRMAGICKSIDEGTDSTVSGEEGVRDIKIIEARYRSLVSSGTGIEIS